MIVSFVVHWMATDTIPSGESIIRRSYRPVAEGAQKTASPMRDGWPRSIFHQGQVVCNLAHRLGFLSFMGRAPEGKIYCRLGANADPNIANLTRVGGETLTYPPNIFRRPTDTGSILPPRA